MNRVYFLILFSISFALLKCNLFDSGNENFEPTFKAEINGETFFDILKISSDNTIYDAVITNQGSYAYLVVFAEIVDETAFPYTEQISFALAFEEDNMTYSSASSFIQIGELGDRRIGGSYYEINGDVLISAFYSPLDDNGVITVNIEELEEGRVAVFGNFEFTTVTNEPLNQFSQRIGQDTLHITNGEYRLLLDDRRE